MLGVDRQVAPPEHLGVLLGRDPADRVDDLGALAGVHGQERRPHGVPTRFRELEVDDGPVERVRYLDEDARAVTGLRFRSPSTPVLEVAQRDQCLGHDVVVAASGQVGDERDTARVVLELRVVQTPSGALLLLVVGHSLRPSHG